MKNKALELNELIWQFVASVPSGSVSTYGSIAKLCGYPSHSRYVGTVLKNLPKDTALPWHRIINGKGELSFPHGSKKYREQRSRLEREGVEFDLKHKVSLRQYQWPKA